MKRIQQLLLAMTLIASIGGAVLVPTSVGAINVFDECQSGASKDSAVCKAAGTDDASSLVKKLINSMLFVLGIVAVIMIVIGGIRYTMSNGDSSSLNNAKNTILYSVVGLVIAMLAYAIVNFVLSRF